MHGSNKTLSASLLLQIKKNIAYKDIRFLLSVLKLGQPPSPLPPENEAAGSMIIDESMPLGIKDDPSSSFVKRENIYKQWDAFIVLEAWLNDITPRAKIVL